MSVQANEGGAATDPPQAKTLEEGLEAAATYQGDPLDCPCIAHMKEGPCGGDFVVAYRCFLDSTEEEKGSDCIESFRAMQQCFMNNPEYYDQFLKDDDDDEDRPKSAEEQWKDDEEWFANNYKRPKGE